MRHESPEAQKPIEVVDYNTLISLEEDLFNDINKKLWQDGAGESRVAKVANRLEKARATTALAKFAVHEDLAGHLHA